MSPSQFYDDLAEYYDLIYADWVKSMARQGGAIAQMLEDLFPEKNKEALRILDVGAGVGTQSLPLAEMGYQVTARDLSPGAISRLSREATSRGLSIDAASADMRSVSKSVEGAFDAVIAFDNCLPHLQTDSEIATTLSQFREMLSPGGVVLVSVRDYDQVDRTPTSSHPYGERTRGDRKYRIEQHWSWLDSSHYRTTFIIDELRDGEWTQVTETDAVYYAISISRLLELLGEAGFLSCRLSEVPFFQPVLSGRNGG